MQKEVKKLIEAIAIARKNYLEIANTFNQNQAEWKPSPEVWNAVEITEHLFWAEQGGIFGMWKTIQAHKEGKPGWEGDAVHAGLEIEEIIAKTWKEKEIVPAVAAPRLGGTLAFWTASLHSLQGVLEEFADELSDDALEIMAHPHPISGAMNIRQRLEFIRFHIERHRGQLVVKLAKKF